MARHGYDHDYGPGVTYREVDLRPHRNEPDSDPNYRGGGYAGMRMEPGYGGQAAYGWYRREHARDLRWDGGAEGRYDPRWDPRRGRFDAEGYFHDPFDEARAHGGRHGGYDAPFGGGYDGEMRGRYGAPRGYDAAFGHRHGPRGGYDAEMRGYDGGMRGREMGGYDRGYGGPVMGSPRPHEGSPRDGGVYAGSGYVRQYDAHSPALRGDGGHDAWYGYAEGGRPLPGDPRRRPTDERGYAGYPSAGYAPQTRPRQALR
jgi:hypothetical protein